MAVALAIVQERMRRNQTQFGLATAADLGRTYISRIERGLMNLTVPKLGQFARGLGLPAWELLRSAEAILERHAPSSSNAIPPEIPPKLV
jgi:transcriptional regulator with XRE-family HTH domain